SACATSAATPPRGSCSPRPARRARSRRCWARPGRTASCFRPPAERPPGRSRPRTPPPGSTRLAAMARGVFPRDEHFMRLALREAAGAAEHGDVPIGAVVVREGEVIGAAGNERELRTDPTAHAETLALREAAATLRGWRLPGTVVYCTLEPCPM